MAEPSIYDFQCRPWPAGAARIRCDANDADGLITCPEQVEARRAVESGWVVEGDLATGSWLAWCPAHVLPYSWLLKVCFAPWQDGHGGWHVCDRAATTETGRCAEHGRQQAWREGRR